jgi:hypothetical protein
MDDLIDSIRGSIAEKNSFAALFVAVCIPDICGKIQSASSNRHYSEWFEEFMPAVYRKHVSGGDAYAIRCATIHQASNDLSLHAAAEKLDKYFFTPEGRHLITVDNLNGDHVRRCVISIRKYCEDIISSYGLWMSDKVENNTELKVRFHDSERSRIKLNVGNVIPGMAIS